MGVVMWGAVSPSAIMYVGPRIQRSATCPLTGTPEKLTSSFGTSVTDTPSGVLIEREEVSAVQEKL